MAKASELVKQEAQLPAAFDYGDDAGVGFEGTTNADLSIPFINVLQSNSPQVDGDSPVEGARPGMLFNTVTQDLSGGADGVPVIPVHFEKAYVEWIPRTKGGGFVALHAADSDTVKAAIAARTEKYGKLILSNGNELIETVYVYVLTLDSDLTTTNGFAVLSLTSTKLKPWKDARTKMQILRVGPQRREPALFHHRLRLTTVKKSNEKGTYYTVDFKPAVGTKLMESLVPTTEAGAALVQDAKAFREMVLSGAARAAFETQDGPASGGGSDEAPF